MSSVQVFMCLHALEQNILIGLALKESCSLMRQEQRVRQEVVKEKTTLQEHFPVTPFPKASPTTKSSAISWGQNV